jgi:hypothetical protein
MKSRKIFLPFVMTMYAYQAFAGTGYAKDGLAFALVFLGLLMVLAGLLYGIDYLQKNGRKLITNSLHLIRGLKRIIAALYKRLRSMHDLMGHMHVPQSGINHAIQYCSDEIT